MDEQCRDGSDQRNFNLGVMTILNNSTLLCSDDSVDGGVLHHHLVSVRREHNRGACYMLSDISAAFLYH